PAARIPAAMKAKRRVRSMTTSRAHLTISDCGLRIADCGLRDCRMSIVDVKRRVDRTARGRRRVVAVIGSGRAADASCADVGRLVASLGCDLLTGGGLGAMEAVSRAFVETSPRRGIAIGVVPATVDSIETIEDRRPAQVEYALPPGYPND